ncbi:MAG: hypothetical protein IKL84_08245 [Clostridia bacterium]|nr:hypothetical protein [Clostridia bacterium]
MATINTKAAGASMRITRFGGIDRRQPSRVKDGVCSAEDICNLRVESDGSLRRRCGYSHRLTLPARVRGMWSGVLGGERIAVAAAGDRLYRIDPDTGEYAEVGVLASGEEDICILFYGGKLYLFDGHSTLVFDGENLSAAVPYVPHITDRRRQSDRYTIHEQPNLLTREAIFSFIAEGQNTYFPLGFRAESIVAAYNITQNITYNAAYYSLDSDLFGNHIVRLPSVPASGDEIVVRVVLDASNFRYARIASCRAGMTYGGSFDNRIFCWGGDVRGEMFCSAPVSEAQIAFGQRYGAASGELYFPADGNFLIGDGRHAVTAVCRHYDRLLIYTEGDTWMVDFGTESSPHFEARPVNSGVGCTAPGAAALAGNDPLTVAAGRVWRWHTSTLYRDECSAETASEEIGDMPGAEFSSGAIAYSHRPRNEVWFADPSGDEGNVFIYHVELGIWYRFSGIPADGFFGWDGEIGFWRGGDFFLFDEEIDTDLDTIGEREILATLILGELDFGSRERFCRTTRLALILDGEYGALSLCCRTDLGRQSGITLAPGGRMGDTETLDRSFRSGRFRRMTLTLSAPAQCWPILRGMTLCAAESL